MLVGKMEIHELSREEIDRLLKRVPFGHLACAKDGQPYVACVNFAASDRHLYGFTTMGNKVEWMRANTLVCVAFEEVKSPREWAAAVVTGRYEELPDAHDTVELRDYAHALLQNKRRQWWEPGYARTVLRSGERPLEPLYFRISIETVTGRRAGLDPIEAGQPKRSSPSVLSSARRTVRKIVNAVVR